MPQANKPFIAALLGLVVGCGSRSNLSQLDQDHPAGPEACQCDALPDPSAPTNPSPPEAQDCACAPASVCQVVTGCHAGSCQYAAAAEGTPCFSGTSIGSCVAGQCLLCQYDAECDDGNTCTADHCDGGRCTHSELHDQAGSVTQPAMTSEVFVTNGIILDRAAADGEFAVLYQEVELVKLVRFNTRGQIIADPIMVDPHARRLAWDGHRYLVAYYELNPYDASQYIVSTGFMSREGGGLTVQHTSVGRAAYLMDLDRATNGTFVAMGGRDWRTVAPFWLSANGDVMRDDMVPAPAGTYYGPTEAEHSVASAIGDGYVVAWLDYHHWNVATEAYITRYDSYGYANGAHPISLLTGDVSPITGLTVATAPTANFVRWTGGEDATNAVVTSPDTTTHTFVHDTAGRPVNVPFGAFATVDEMATFDGTNFVVFGYGQYQGYGIYGARVDPSGLLLDDQFFLLRGVSGEFFQTHAGVVSLGDTHLVTYDQPGGYFARVVRTCH